MLGGVPERQVFKLDFQPRQLQLNGPQEPWLLQVRLERCLGGGRLLRSDARLPASLAREYVKLKRVDRFKPMQPRDGQGRARLGLGTCNQLRRRLGFDQRKVKPREKIRVRVWPHSPARSLSTRRVCSGVKAFGKTFSIRARKSGIAMIRSGPVSGRMVYVRPLRLRILTAPSRSQAFKTAAGSRSSSRTVNVFMADILSAFISRVKPQNHPDG